MIRKVLLRCGAAFGFLALAGCYVNFRSETYRSSAEALRVAGLNLGLCIRQAHYSPGMIYRDNGPYQVDLRLEGKSGIHESVTVHRLVVRDRSSGETWTIVSAPVMIPFQEDGSTKYYLAQRQFEASFQPVFSENKILEVDIDLSVKTKGKVGTRRTFIVPFKGGSYEFKGFITFGDLMSV